MIYRNRLGACIRRIYYFLFSSVLSIYIIAIMSSSIYSKTFMVRLLYSQGKFYIEQLAHIFKLFVSYINKIDVLESMLFVLVVIPLQLKRWWNTHWKITILYIIIALNNIIWFPLYFLKKIKNVFSDYKNNRRRVKGQPSIP